MSKLPPSALIKAIVNVKEHLRHTKGGGESTVHAHVRTVDKKAMVSAMARELHPSFEEGVDKAVGRHAESGGRVIHLQHRDGKWRTSNTKPEGHDKGHYIQVSGSQVHHYHNGEKLGTYNLHDHPDDAAPQKTPAPAEASAPEKKSAKPHEMTYGEYRESAFPDIGGSRKSDHERSVRQALEAGKQVPDRVLAEYPHLKGEIAAEKQGRADADKKMRELGDTSHEDRAIAHAEAAMDKPADRKRKDMRTFPTHSKEIASVRGKTIESVRTGGVRARYNNERIKVRDGHGGWAYYEYRDPKLAHGEVIPDVAGHGDRHWHSFEPDDLRAQREQAESDKQKSREDAHEKRFVVGESGGKFYVKHAPSGTILDRGGHATREEADGLKRRLKGTRFDTDEHPQAWMPYLSPESKQQLAEVLRPGSTKKATAADKKEAQRTAHDLADEAAMHGLTAKQHALAKELLAQHKGHHGPAIAEAKTLAEKAGAVKNHDAANSFRAAARHLEEDHENQQLGFKIERKPGSGHLGARYEVTGPNGSRPYVGFDRNQARTALANAKAQHGQKHAFETAIASEREKVKGMDDAELERYYAQARADKYRKNAGPGSDAALVAARDETSRRVIEQHTKKPAPIEQEKKPAPAQKSPDHEAYAEEARAKVQDMSPAKLARYKEESDIDAEIAKTEEKKQRAIAHSKAADERFAEHMKGVHPEEFHNASTPSGYLSVRRNAKGVQVHEHYGDRKEEVVRDADDLTALHAIHRATDQHYLDKAREKNRNGGTLGSFRHLTREQQHQRLRDEEEMRSRGVKNNGKKGKRASNVPLEVGDRVYHQATGPANKATVTKVRGGTAYVKPDGAEHETAIEAHDPDVVHVGERRGGKSRGDHAKARTDAVHPSVGDEVQNHGSVGVVATSPDKHGRYKIAMKHINGMPMHGHESEGVVGDDWRHTGEQDHETLRQHGPVK